MHRLFPAFLACCVLALWPADPARAQTAPLTLISVQPQGQVDSLTQITVRFSEAMRPLGVMEQDPATTPLLLTVPGGSLPPGNFRWLDPATLAYLFDQPVSVPLRIEARIPAGVKALSGAALDRDAVFSLRTPPLKVSAEAGPLPPEGGVVALYANYPLDIRTLKEKLRLSRDRDVLDFELDEEIPAYISGRQTRWTYLLRLKTPLRAEQKVRLHLAPGLATRDGGEAAPAMDWTFSSFGRLKLTEWRAGYASKGPMPPEDDVFVFFNNPVAYRDLLAHLEIHPRPEPDPEQAEADPGSDTGFRLPYRWDARTRYRITLRPGLEDAYGGSLTARETFTFSTDDFRPFFHMQQGMVVLERGLGGLYPLDIRNVSPVGIRLVYHPDPTAVLRHLDGNTIGEDPGRLPGAREYTTVLDFSGQSNTNIRHTLDIPQLLGLDPRTMRGLVLLEVSIPGEGRNNQRVQRALLQCTDLGLTFKNGRDASLAWVTGLDKATPLEGARLRLLDARAEVLWEGTSGPDGTAALPGRERFETAPKFLIAETDADLNVLALEFAQLPRTWQDQFETTPDRQPWAAHMITQLPLYQPGQTVRFTLYAGSFTDRVDGARLAAPDWIPLAHEPLTLIVRDNRRKVVHQQRVSANAYGSVSGDFTLSPEANLGPYSFTVQTPRFRQETSGLGFQVAAFRPPEFAIEVTAPASRPALLPEEKPLRAEVSAAYFSGAALPGAAVRFRLTQSDAGFAPALLQGYKTGPDDLGLWRIPGRPSAQAESVQEARLDGEGRTSFTLPELPVNRSRPQEISLEATVTDASGLTSQGVAGFMLHPAAIYAGLRCPRFTPPDRLLTVDVKAATWDNRPVARTPFRLKAERLSRAGEEPEPVWEQRLELTSSQGQPFDIRFEKSGTYRLSVIVADSQGRENMSATTLYVAGPDMEWISNRPSGSMELMTDREAYAPGDIAHLALKSPYAEALALISVERGGVRTHEIRKVSGPAPTVDIPLGPDDAPYVYVSATLVRGRIAEPDIPGDPGHDRGSPQVSHGVALLKVTDPQAPGLKLSLTTDKDVYRPGDAVQVAVRATDRQGAGRKSQITLLAVDERVLRAAGDRLRYDPAQTFTPLFSYGVRAADTRRLLLNLSPPILRERRSMAAFAPAPIMQAEAKMGAESANLDLAAATGGNTEAVRENFSPMAYWLAEGETDARGELRLEFSLPDSLTGYRLVAVASDTRHYAVAERSVTASKPLQLISALPRFAIAGDRLEARVLVQNLGDTARQVTVEASAEGLSLEWTSATLELPAGASGTVGFPAMAAGPGQAGLTVRAVSGAERDSARFSLPVLPAAPLTAVAASGLLRQGTEESLPLALPDHPDPRSSLEVVFAPSPAAGLSLAGQELLEYPWDCLEQRFSRAWLRALRVQHGRLLGLPADAADRERIRETLESAGKFQSPDGGFGLWPGLNASDFYLTAYVLLVNSQTEALGLSLDEPVATAALAFLRDRLYEAYRDPRNEHAPEIEALALWHLARAGDSLGKELFPKVLLQAEQHGVPMAWGMLLLTNDLLYGDQPEAYSRHERRLLAGLDKLAAVTPTQTHFAAQRSYAYWMSLGSTLRDNGLVLGALAGKDYPRLDALASWVGQGLGESVSLSTQETIFGIWGLAEYLQSLGGDGPVSLEAVWNEETVTKRFSRLLDTPQIWRIPAAGLSRPADDAVLKFRALEGTPYWTARLRYRDVEATPKPENAGFTISRSWTPRTPDKPLRVGDLVDVSVSLTVPATRRHVLLFDPFPAGLEPLYASRADLADADRQYQRPWQFQESRTDGMLLYAARVDPGVYTYTYTLRAAVPGDFIQRPSHVEEMYTSEVRGSTSGDRVRVAP